MVPKCRPIRLRALAPEAPQGPKPHLLPNLIGEAEAAPFQSEHTDFRSDGDAPAAPQHARIMDDAISSGMHHGYRFAIQNCAPPGAAATSYQVLRFRTGSTSPACAPSARMKAASSSSTAPARPRIA